MTRSGSIHRLIAVTPIILGLAASGCATKKYVGQHISPVNQRLTQVQQQTNEQLEKQQREISQLDERVITTDNRLTAVANTAQQANATAGQALQQAQTNASAIEAGVSQINAHSAELVRLANNFNYSLVESGDVTFGLNKWELSKDAKAALDLMVKKVAETPRAAIEVLGYTDNSGPASYNLTLSRRRAESVARYLVKNGVALKDISLIGLGKEQTPELLAAEVQGFNPNASKQEIRGLARRVRIRVYAPGASSTAAAGAGTAAELQK